ncbi:MAG: response regulator [Verrucomicrobiota bacterium]
MSGRILVLDDEENYAEMLRDLLLENNYRVDTATRPEQAIMQLEEIPYDLVIADYKMPVMDGAGFLKRSRELYPNLPFILVSGLMNTPELVKVANMSVTLVLEKPLDTELFLESVARFSKPSTQEERVKALEVPESLTDAKEETPAMPHLPRFFSGGSKASTAFLEKAWSVLSSGSFLYVGSPKGGDLDLALKDLSEWFGNEDKPIKQYTLPAIQELGMAGLIEQDFSEMSRLALVRLSNATQIAEAQDFAAATQDNDSGIKIVFEIPCAYLKNVKGLERELVQLPDFIIRKMDTARYARRIARVTAERLSKTNCAEFTSEVVFAILEYPWPRNYSELQSAIQSAISESEDTPLALASFGKLFARSRFETMIPNDRLKYLLTKAQPHILAQMATNEAGGLDPIIKELNIDSGITDLESIPLLKPEIGEI